LEQKLLTNGPNSNITTQLASLENRLLNSSDQFRMENGMMNTSIYNYLKSSNKDPIVHEPITPFNVNVLSSTPLHNNSDAKVVEVDEPPNENEDLFGKYDDAIKEKRRAAAMKGVETKKQNKEKTRIANEKRIREEAEKKEKQRIDRDKRMADRYNNTNFPYNEASDNEEHKSNDHVVNRTIFESSGANHNVGHTTQPKLHRNPLTGHKIVFGNFGDENDQDLNALFQSPTKQKPGRK